MKKLFLFIYFFLSLSLSYAAFVPAPGALYNIVQNSSNFVIGASLTQPVVLTGTGSSAQAFEFIAVDGLIDTYYIKNAEGNYLSRSTATTWDTKMVTAVDGANTQWVITGDGIETSFRLQNVATTKYLSSDGTITGSVLYCDKPVTEARGIFSLVAGVVTSFTFVLSESNVALEIEKNYNNNYPLYLTAMGQANNIDIVASAGFSVDKTKITPAEFSNAANHKIKVQISATGVIGAVGTVTFSFTSGGTTHTLNTLNVVAVDTYPRINIKNQTSGNVIGNLSTDNSYPAFNANIGDVSQKFILRRANPDVMPNDNIYYLVQDGEYRMLRKVPANDWDTEFGGSCEEAKWLLELQANGSYYIKNIVKNAYLGFDNTNIDTRLYDDKAATEWIIETASTAGFGNLFSKVKFGISNNGLTVMGADSYVVYNVQGVKIADVKVNPSQTIKLKPGIYIVKATDIVQKIVIK